MTHAHDKIQAIKIVSDSRRADRTAFDRALNLTRVWYRLQHAMQSSLTDFFRQTRKEGERSRCIANKLARTMIQPKKLGCSHNHQKSPIKTPNANNQRIFSKCSRRIRAIMPKPTRPIRVA